MSHIRLQILYPPDNHPFCVGLEVYIDGKRKNKVSDVRFLPETYSLFDLEGITFHEELVNDRKLLWAEFDADVECDEFHEFGLCSLCFKNVKKCDTYDDPKMYRWWEKQRT